MSAALAARLHASLSDAAHCTACARRARDHHAQPLVIGRDIGKPMQQSPQTFIVWRKLAHQD
jgi:hypothetical protein